MTWNVADVGVVVGCAGHSGHGHACRLTGSLADKVPTSGGDAAGPDSALSVAGSSAAGGMAVVDS